MHDIDLIENHLALYISCIYGCLPESAFDFLDGKTKKPRKEITITKEDVQDMKKMLESGMTLQEVSDVYFLTPTKIKNAIRRKGDTKDEY